MNKILRLSFPVLVSALVLGVSISALAAPVASTINLGVASAARGATVSISGAHFHNGDTVHVTITGHSGNIEVGTITVSGNTFTGSTTIPSDATIGSDTVTATDASSNSATATLTVSAALTAQTITVNTHAPSSAVYNSTFPVAASASSGLTVAITITGGCSIAAGTVTMTSGTTACVVHYNQAGNGTYSAAPEVTESTTATPKSITSSVTASNKVYDGGTTATVATCSLSGVVSPDVVTCSASGATFSNKHVGTSKNVVATGITLGGTNAANYSLSSATAATTANITASPITVTAAANSKTYDAGTTASAIPTVTSGAIQAGDTANFTEAYSDKTVGTGKTLTPSGSVTDGNSGNDYAVTFVNSASGVITAKSVSITGMTAADQVYDGGTAVHTISNAGSLVGVVGGDTVSFGAGTSYTMATKNVGTGKTVTTTGVALTGVDAGNYTLSAQPATTVNVTAKSLTVTATGINKAYTGDTSATVTLSTDALGGDNVTVGYTSAQFASSDIGTGIAVSVTGIAISGGTDAGNYTLANTTANTTANITVSAAVVALAAAQNLNPTYDGTSKAISFTTTPANVPLSVTYNGSATAPTNAGTYTVVATVTDPNYAGSDQETLVIAPAALAITASNATKTYGSAVTFAGSEFSSGTLYGSDSVTSVTLTSSGAVATAAVSGSPYSITPSSAVGTGLANYTITYNTGSLTVNKAALSVTPDNKTKVQGSLFTSFTGSIVGIANGDNLTATYASAGAISSAATGTYPISATLVDPDTKAGNYNVTLNTGSLVVTAQVASLTVTTVVSNNGGGSLSASAFTAQVTDAATTQNVTGNEAGATISVQVGTYTVAPISVTGYSVSLSGGCSGVASANAALSCTITETYSPSYIYGGGNAPDAGGVVLGTSTETAAPDLGVVLGTSTDVAATTTTSVATTTPVCLPLTTKDIRYGKKNDVGVVTQLQNFLNTFEGNKLKVTGVYDKATRAAVVAFQVKYKDDILKPWGISKATGIVRFVTVKKINELSCKLPIALTPDQIKELQKLGKKSN